MWTVTSYCELNCCLCLLQVIPVAMDVRDPEAVRKAADVFVEKCGCLPHMVVNNAAGNFISPTERLSPNAFRTIVDIVLVGSANVTLEFGKRLIEAKQGCAILHWSCASLSLSLTHLLSLQLLHAL